MTVEMAMEEAEAKKQEHKSPDNVHARLESQNV